MALALVGCGAPQTYAPAPPAEARFVVLRPGARLCLDPNPAGQCAADPLAKAADPASRWRWLGSRDRWHWVESVAAEDAGSRSPRAHCVGPEPALHGLALRLWVAEADLGAVTARAVRHEWDDGTAVELPPGQPVGKAVGTLHDVPLRPIPLGSVVTALPMPDAALAGSYAPQPLPVATTHTDHWLGAEDQPLLGGGPLLGVGALAPVWHVERVEDRGLYQLATVSVGCGRLVLRIGKNQVADLLGAIVGGLGVGTTARATSIRAGAEVWWPDGRWAGRAEQQAAVGEPRPGPPGLRCHALWLRRRWPTAQPRDPQAALTVCARPADILPARQPLLSR